MSNILTRGLARLAGLAAVIALAFVVALGFASPASATTAASVSAVASQGVIVKTVTGSCGGGRCNITLSKSETASLARGSVPALTIPVPIQLRAAYYAFAYAHRWFAGQYAARGWCSGFQLSIYPWESQGYYGKRC